MIDEYVRSLDRSLAGPARIKTDLLTEARHSLVDAVEDYRAGGLPAADAERQAIDEFGSVGRLATCYQAELAASAVRSLALRVAAVWLLFMFTTDQMWRGAPWTGPRPPAGYRLLSDSLDWLSIGYGLAAAASFVWLTWSARRGQPGSIRLARAIGLALTGALALGWLGGIAVYAWSVDLWEGALTWPPMIVGMAMVSAAYAWLGSAAWSCLTSTRWPADRAGVTPAPAAAPRRPGTGPPSN